MPNSFKRLVRRIKLRDLDTLGVVVSCGGIRKAAEQLHLSQPAVSKAIAGLEEDVGYPLLVRTQRGVEVTAYGEALLRRSGDIFDTLLESLRELETLADPDVGEIRFACTEPVMAGLIAAAMQRITRQYPKVRFRVESFGTDLTQVRALMEHDCDFVLVRPHGMTLDREIKTEPLYYERLQVVAGQQTSWARRRKMDLAELVDAPWILSSIEILSRDSPFAQSFEALGLPLPKAGIVTGSVHLRVALVESGQFITVMPRALLHFNAMRYALKILPVELHRWKTPNMILTLRDRPLNPVTEKFIDVIREMSLPLTK
jgi:DNA-binding transcriptional LysR family regulator